ncbi:DUF3103 family protein [Nocardioides sp. GCM10030258]|uniref:DUF3103 family protein n=1 Tax=unclassified Nocardioides TaxID=2615069 RepID=UPI00360C14A0
MKKLLRAPSRRPGAALAVIGLVLAGTAAVSQSTASAAPSGPTDAEIDSSLDYLAKKLATATASADLRSTIHKAVAKRFDGDEEALWSSLASDPSFSAKVAGRDKSSAVTSRAGELPRLQIAVPSNFDSWDPDKFAPLVAYLPQSVDDNDLKTIRAYDAAGNVVELDAHVEPSQPVIVLGLNERTDETGKVLESFAESSKSSPAAELELSSDTTMAAAAAVYSVDMRVVELIKDNEPWAAGSAEIALKARSKGCSGTEYITYDWTNLDHDGDVWAPGPPRNLGTTSCAVAFAWWEDDGGASNFQLYVGDFKMGVSMDNGDDMIGTKLVGHATFQGSSMEEHDFDDLEFWVE